MAKFIWKPEVVDFGYEPCTKSIRFIHEGTDLEILSFPLWMTDVSLSHSTYTGGDIGSGVITATVRADATRHQESGLITVKCDADTFLIPVVYYYDSEHIPILDVIDSVLAMNGDDSFVGPRDRNKAILAAKRWLQDNSGVTGTNVRFAELNVTGNRVYCPADFVDYVGLFVVSEDGYLSPLYVNPTINTGQNSLVDENAFFLLDDGGFVIGAYGLTPRVDNELPYTYQGVDIGSLMLTGGSQITYQIKPGQLSLNGMYKYDAINRFFMVDGLAIDKVVLEYVSDPILRNKLKMDMGEIRVHKTYQEALEKHIYYAIIETNRHAPVYEKQRALHSYKMALKRANMRKLSINELIQVLRGNN